MRLQNQEGLNQQDSELFKTFREKQYQGHKKCPTAMAWNTQGNLLVTAEVNIKVWLFSEEHGLDKGSELARVHDTNIDWVEFATQNMFATLSREIIKFWDVREYGKISSLKSQKKSKQDLFKFTWNHSATGEGSKLAVITKDNTVLIYDYRNIAQPVNTIAPKSNSSLQYCGAAWDRSDSVLFLVGGESNNGSISLFSAQTFQPLAEPIVTHCARITDICFSNDNEKFATASEDSMLEIHSIPDVICQRVFNNKSDGSYRRVSFSCDGKYLAASSDSNNIEIWNAEKGGQSWKLKSSVNQQVLGWHPKKLVLAYIDEEDKRKSMDRGEDSYLHLFYQ